MSVLEKILGGIRAKREAATNQASESYGELVQRLALGKAHPADTVEHVDMLLARAHLGPDDLAADVERAQAHYRLRQRCRAAASAHAESREATDRWTAATAHEREEARRLRAASEAAYRATLAADARARELKSDLERVLAVAQPDLASGYREADAAWRAALEAFDRAKQDGDTEGMAAREREAATARSAVDKALAALLAHDPAPAALRAEVVT
jgi:hypothetical protein